MDNPMENRKLTIYGESSKSKAKFLIDIEKKIRADLRLIKESDGKLLEDRQSFIDAILQVYREGFDALLENMSTFKALLLKIKEVYENALAIRDERISSYAILNRVLGAEKQNKYKEYDLLKEENSNLKHDLNIYEQRSANLKEENERLQKEALADHLALSVERDARYALMAENLKLKNQINDLQSNDNATKDPVILKLALEQSRKDLSKVMKEFNAMIDDYTDAVPKKDYDLLESNHLDLKRKFDDITVEFNNMNDNYANLLDEHSKIKDEFMDVKERCSDLERSGTPRPQWDICGEFIGGGGTRWKHLTKGLSSRENLIVILKELGPTAQRPNFEYFEGLGNDPVIPEYLHYEGKIRNLRLSRRDLSILINDIWTAKSMSNRELSLQDFLKKYFIERYQQVNARAEWAYNLYNSCEQMVDDPQIKLFWGVLQGALSQDIYYSLKAEWTRFKENVLDSLQTGQNIISIGNMERIIKVTFPMKSDVEIRNIIDIIKKQMKIKPNIQEIDAVKLFTENEEGFDRIDLARELLRQRQISQEKYLREIINQLGGKRNGNKPISVENLKRAFAIIDPHIDHVIMESNIRWAFSDNTSDLNMIFPKSLKTLAAKLSSGNIQRVGPKYKIFTSKNHKY